MSESKRVVIVGGVAGGASCAARLRRRDESAQITLLEAGPYVSFANCGLPYHVGGVIPEESSLLVTSAAALTANFRLNVCTNTRALAIDRVAKVVRVRGPNGEEDIGYDSLVLSPGAEPVRPALPGLDQDAVFTLRTVPDAAAIRRWIAQRNATRAVVVGGGFIGIEMVEKMDQVMPPADPEFAAVVQDRLESAGVSVYCGEGLSEISEDLTVVTDARRRLPADLVIVAIGVRPKSDLAAAAGLECGPRGHVVVDDQMRSADPAIFAIGDVAQVTDVITGQATALPLAGPANRQGRLVADVICGDDAHFRGVQGTAVVGCFDLTLAQTGLTEKAAQRAGLADIGIARLHRGHHVGYYPGATPITLKLIYNTADGRILGAQAVGRHGVDKRIDVLAMAIQMGATVDDLAEAELCYAPQYGAAKDPVNLIGMVAQNARAGLVRFSQWGGFDPAAITLLDVRPPALFAREHHPAAINIPLPELRDRLHELDRSRPIHVACVVGQTAYNAARILMQAGFEAWDIAGGMTTGRVLKKHPGGG